jgi:hypothetical protein
VADAAISAVFGRHLWTLKAKQRHRTQVISGDHPTDCARIIGRFKSTGDPVRSPLAVE